MCYFALQGFRRIISLSIGGTSCAGAVTGILGAFQFFGGGLSGFLDAVIIDNGGYIPWIISLIIPALLGVLLCTLYMTRFQLQKYILQAMYRKIYN